MINTYRATIILSMIIFICILVLGGAKLYACTHMDGCTGCDLGRIPSCMRALQAEEALKNYSPPSYSSAPYPLPWYNGAQVPSYGGEAYPKGNYRGGNSSMEENVTSWWLWPTIIITCIFLFCLFFHKKKQEL
jgi:hypothetical protein